MTKANRRRRRRRKSQVVSVKNQWGGGGCASMIDAAPSISAFIHSSADYSTAKAWENSLYVRVTYFEWPLYEHMPSLLTHWISILWHLIWHIVLRWRSFDNWISHASHMHPQVLNWIPLSPKIRIQRFRALLACRFVLLSFAVSYHSHLPRSAIAFTVHLLRKILTWGYIVRPKYRLAFT